MFSADTAREEARRLIGSEIEIEIKESGRTHHLLYLAVGSASILVDHGRGAIRIPVPSGTMSNVGLTNITHVVIYGAGVMLLVGDQELIGEISATYSVIYRRYKNP